MLFASTTFDEVVLPAAQPLIPSSWTLPLGVLLVLVVIALVAWALQLAQAAMDQREFSLMWRAAWCARRVWVWTR